MLRLLEADRALVPFEGDIELRMANYRRMLEQLTQGGSLNDFANAHEFFGFHRTPDGCACPLTRCTTAAASRPWCATATA